MRRDGIELLWPGKYDAAGERSAIPSPGLRTVPVARYGAEPPQGTLVRGDNLALMDALVRGGDPGIDLVIIDPPFATGEDFSVLTQIGEGREVLRAPAYSDRWQGGLGGFMAMLDPRLRLVHRLLADHGSLYVHLDANVAHPVKVLLDEIFGPGCFQREIIWRIGWVSGFKSRARNWIRNHDTILFYVKDPGQFTFNKRYIPYPPGYRRRDGKAPKGVGIPIDDVWNAGAGDLGLRGADSLDSIQIKSFSREKTGWATQKNESLLRRIIDVSSRPGDRVADFFCGSGSTLAAATALGRRWIGCDRSSMAIHLARKRLREVDAAFTLCELEPEPCEALPIAAERPPEEIRCDSTAGSAEPPKLTRGQHVQPGGEICEELLAGLEIGDQEAWLRVCPPRKIELAELRGVQQLAASRGCQRLRVVAGIWGFAVAEVAPVIDTTCLHWRGHEPALPRSKVDIRWSTPAPWQLVVEIISYQPGDPSLLPDATVVDQVSEWSEWIDAWALAINSPQVIAEMSNKWAVEADRGLFVPIVEHFRTRRKRSLLCASKPVEIAEACRASRISARVQIVDILGLETIWPWELVFDEQGKLSTALPGHERASAACLFA